MINGSSAGIVKAHRHADKGENVSCRVLSGRHVSARWPAYTTDCESGLLRDCAIARFAAIAAAREQRQSKCASANLHSHNPLNFTLRWGINPHCKFAEGIAQRNLCVWVLAADGAARR
jgi:hypothetical protein